MKILVISDTHGNINNVLSILEKNQEIDRIIHLGDNEKDAEDLEYITSLPIDYVPGNCDYMSNNQPEKILSLVNKRIFITHGHYYGVKKNLEKIKKIGIENNFDMILYGHTHIACIEKYKKLSIINPGSITDPRDGKGCSFALLEIDDMGRITIGIKKI